MIADPHKAPRGARCDAIKDNGRRCRKRATVEMGYFGEGELYHWQGPTPKWVLVRLCVDHNDEKDDVPNQGAK